MPLDKSNQRIRSMFGQIAPRYDLLNHLLSLGIDQRWRRRATRLVPPRPADSDDSPAPILDVCAGTGDLALAWARVTDGATPIIAADFCRPMVQIARKKVARAGLQDRLTVIEADTLRLPFIDDQFQIVSAAFGLRNVSDSDRGLAEMTRVCRPGGRVVVLEFAAATIWPFSVLYRFYFHTILPMIGQRLAKNRQSAYHYLPSSVEQFPQREALLARMQAAGLVDTWYKSMTMGIVALHVGTKPLSDY